MKIRHPDGTILQAPDNADPLDVMAQYNFEKKFGHIAAADPNKGVGAGQRFLEGIGAGMVNVVRRGGNLFTQDEDEITTPVRGRGMVTSKRDKDSFFSDEAIRQQEEADKPLTDTTAGFLGKLAGETAITAPIGGVVGSGVKALAAAPSLVRATPLLSRALGSSIGRSGVEGAVQGALLADEGEGAGDALMGAGLSGTLTGLTKAGGRLVKGLVKKSQAADDLERLAADAGEDLDIPLAQAASEDDLVSRLGKSVYKHILPNVLGVEGRLTKQARDASKVVRKMTLQDSLPDGVSLADDAAENTGRAVRQIRKEFDKKYDDVVKTEVFPVAPTITSDITKAIQAQIPNINDTSLNRAVSKIDGLVDKYRSGNLIMDGDNALNLKNEVSQLISELKPGADKEALVAGWKSLNDILIRKQLQKVGKLADYDALTEPYSNFSVLRKAAKAARANKGNFTSKQLAQVSPPEGQMGFLGETAHEVLGQSPGKGNFLGRSLASIAMGGVGVANLPAAIGMFVGGHALSSKTAQRALLGNTRIQRAMSKALRKTEKFNRRLGTGLRAAAVSNLGDDNARN